MFTGISAKPGGTLRIISSLAPDLGTSKTGYITHWAKDEEEEKPMSWIAKHGTYIGLSVEHMLTIF